MLLVLEGCVCASLWKKVVVLVSLIEWMFVHFLGYCVREGKAHVNDCLVDDVHRSGYVPTNIGFLILKI